MAWINKGDDFCSLKKYDEALDAFEEAIRLNSNDYGTWYSKGKALKALGRTIEANAAFAKAKELGYNGPS